MSATLYPSVLWAERNETVSLTVDVQVSSDLVIDLNEKGLKFSALSGSNKFAFELSFPYEIDVENSKYHCDRVVRILLSKKEHGRWNKVTTEPGRKHWLTCDWDKWQDSEDELDRGVDDSRDFLDMEELMKGQGNGMPDFNNDEEDDEDADDDACEQDADLMKSQADFEVPEKDMSTADPVQV